MARRLNIGENVVIKNVNSLKRTEIASYPLLFLASIYECCEIDVSVRDELVCYGSNIPRYLTHQANWEAYMMYKFNKGAQIWYMET